MSPIPKSSYEITILMELQVNFMVYFLYRIKLVLYTEEMLKEARQNAGELAENICWMVGDAQKLELDEEDFDAVVTRNVTWNLPDPARAYQEWYRVLKKDGILLNFDADWYGHLFDEQKTSSLKIIMATRIMRKWRKLPDRSR